MGGILPKAQLNLKDVVTPPSTLWQVLQTMMGMLRNWPASSEMKYPLSEFLSSDVSHNLLLRSLWGPDGCTGHWGYQEAQRDSFTMCNYRRDKLNAQQSKAFPDLWLLDFDKGQAAFFGQFTVGICPQNWNTSANEHSYLEWEIFVSGVCWGHMLRPVQIVCMFHWSNCEPSTCA